jgi:integrase
VKRAALRRLGEAPPKPKQSAAPAREMRRRKTMARTDNILEQQLPLILAALTPGNRRVIQVMLRTGLRVSDVLELRRDKLARQFTVRESKTGKRMKCGLPDWLRADILRNSQGSDWAFPSPTDPKRHRSRQAVWADLKRAQRALRLPVNLRTHSARKTYAVHLMHQYGDIDKVRRALNHDNATVTVVYAMADMLAATAAERHVSWKRKR